MCNDSWHDLHVDNHHLQINTAGETAHSGTLRLLGSFQNVDQIVNRKTSTATFANRTLVFDVIIYGPALEALKSEVSEQRATITSPPVQQEFDEQKDNQEEQEILQEMMTESINEIKEPELDTPEEREKFYQELVKARATERKKAIAEGKMDDPLVPKRLEDAITIVGTCMDMCPRFERYRRERENNLFEWETIPGTKRVNHNRAVKMYERAAGDKTLPSDLRPPHVLKRTLDYLFHDLLPRGGLVQTCNFIRDRSRAVRNDFTMQHITGPLAIACHDRCARFHILTLHMVRDLEQNQVGFVQMEEQQLMNTLQSLKEFYEDQRGRYESPTELEMRVYHRLIHIRDQKERHEDIPDHITSHPVFKLTTDFRRHVQQKSTPISKTSPLVVDADSMAIFGQLAAVLAEQGSIVMIYLVACILERLFGKGTVEDIEAIRGDLTISDIIDGISTKADDTEVDETDEMEAEDWQEDETELQQVSAPSPLKPSSNGWLSSSFTSQPPTSTPASTAPSVATSAFAGLVSTPNVFGTPSIFGGSAFSNLNQPPTPPASDPRLQADFGGPAASTSISMASTPLVAAVNPTPFSNGSTSSPSIPNFFGSKGVQNPLVLTSGTSQPEPPKSIFNGLSGSQPGQEKIQFFSIPAPPNSAPPSLNPQAQPFTPQVLLPAPTTQRKASSSSLLFPSPSPTPADNIQTISTNLPSFSSLPTPTTNGTPASTPSSSSPAPPSFFNSDRPSATPPLPSSLPTTFVSGRLTAPPLLKINTNTSISSSSTSSSIGSPQLPPPLPKPKPIPLPSTPSTSIHLLNPLLDHLRSTLDSPGTPRTPEALSPLVIGTPTASGSKTLHNFSPFHTTSSTKQDTLLTTNGKGKAPQTPKYDENQVEEMKNKALAFAQRSLLVKNCFKRWLKVAVDKAAWLEACQHGDAYREKLHNRSLPAPQLSLTNGKRRMSDTGIASGEVNSPPAQRKRARRRISSQYHPPRTDEELAKRFKENHEEHELRWAQGSFLQVVRKHVNTRWAATSQLPWQIWLSMNPESDATAIWLERKFDIPVSGSWASDSIFTIPLSSEVSNGSTASGSPGMIVFECTPLGDVADNLEKKYRILDDCSRLRDIVKALPAKRRYIPSLFIICWTEGEEIRAASDFFDMVKKLVADSVLQSYQIFAMTAVTKDLDNKFDTALQSLDLDLEGKLVQTLSLRGVFKIFETTFSSFLSEWIENCSTNGSFNWCLYAQLVQVCVTLFNTMSLLVQSLLEAQGQQEPLPAFDCTQLEDSESTFDDVNEWLSHWNSQDDARMVAMDLQSHRNIGQDFPTRIFIEHLFEITRTRFQRLHSKFSNNQFIVPTSSITSSIDSFKETMRHQQMKLLQILNFSVRRSPKRRLNSVAPSEQDSPETKRPRFSASIASTNDDHSIPSTPLVNGRDSASPTNSILSLAPMEEQPTITVAMLRALTRDMKRKYVGS
ncbi:hypothetical protein BYT27DRAFT_7249958 [Phlegmacium glaucopus]|nr:hypothetical protein BYT27DRAFT_7249958 [Phlegmacium glaucopus]